jgi:uncharacterized protein with NRDE domain
VLTSAATADRGVSTFASTVRPEAYNAAWMLVGDRHSLHYIALDGTSRFSSRTLGPGIHILENLGIDEPSTKVDRARELLGDPSGLSEDDLLRRLKRVVADHQGSPPGASDRPSGADDGTGRRPACVHGDSFGTRSSTIVLVSAEERPPSVFVADGRPCEVPFVDETTLWLADPTASPPSIQDRGRSAR